MEASGVNSFRKTAACPSESVLISYSSRKLAGEIMSLVRFHLGSCDFCAAELPLLSFYSHPQRGESRAPEIPMNLRMLAESLLSQNEKIKPPKGRVERRKRRSDDFVG
jgi:hypothetical protein